jgi:hypothetical protein
MKGFFIALFAKLAYLLLCNLGVLSKINEVSLRGKGVY